MALGSAGAFIGGLTEAGRPFLNQIVQDQRKKKRQQERSQFITQNLQALDPNVSAEEATARANLQVAGFPAPAQQPERPDLSELTTEFGLPDSFNKAWQAGALGDDPIKAIQLFTKAAGKEAGPPTETEFNLVKAAGGYEDIPDYETLKAVHEVKDFIGGTVGTVFPDAQTDGTKAPDRNARIAAVQKEMEGMSLRDIKADANLMRRYFAAGGTEEQLFQSFGFNPDAIADARSSIVKKVRESSIDIGVDLQGSLVKWINNEEVDGSEVFDKYYDKKTGEIDEDALFKEAELNQRLEAKRLGMEPAEFEEIPPDLKQSVLEFKGAGMTKADMEAIIKLRKDEGNLTTEEESQLRRTMEHLDG